MAYWEANRERDQKISRQILLGLPVGLLASLPVFLVLFSSRFWYKRADAVAQSQMHPAVLMIALFILSVFVAVFYKRYRWEQQDQLYNELKYKERIAEKNETCAANEAPAGS